MPSKVDLSATDGNLVFSGNNVNPDVASELFILDTSLAQASAPV